MEVSSGFHSTNRIPGNSVILTFGNSQMAIGADPALVIFRAESRSCLHRVFDSALYFSSLDSDSNSLKIEWLKLGTPLGTAVATRFH
jgi:hypothetical protein